MHPLQQPLAAHGEGGDDAAVRVEAPLRCKVSSPSENISDQIPSPRRLVSRGGRVRDGADAHLEVAPELIRFAQYSPICWATSSTGALVAAGMAIGESTWDHRVGSPTAISRRRRCRASVG